MTISRSINAAALSDRLSNFADGAETLREKEVIELLGLLTDQLISGINALGFAAPTCDAARNVEAVLYGYFADANPVAAAHVEKIGERANV